MAGRYDSNTLVQMRRLLDELLVDQRFTAQNRKSALEVAEHVLALAASGERDPQRIKASVLSSLGEANAAWSSAPP
jgi:hypothetical protein